MPLRRCSFEQRVVLQTGYLLGPCDGPHLRRLCALHRPGLPLRPYRHQAAALGTVHVHSLHVSGSLVPFVHAGSRLDLHLALSQHWPALHVTASLALDQPRLTENVALGSFLSALARAWPPAATDSRLQLQAAKFLPNVERGGDLVPEPCVSGSSAASFHREESVAVSRESAGVGSGPAVHAIGLAGQVLGRQAGHVGVHLTDADSFD